VQHQVRVCEYTGIGGISDSPTTQPRWDVGSRGRQQRHRSSSQTSPTDTGRRPAAGPPRWGNRRVPGKIAGGAGVAVPGNAGSITEAITKTAMNPHARESCGSDNNHVVSNFKLVDKLGKLHRKTVEEDTQF
jgi:hypothetical protein